MTPRAGSLAESSVGGRGGGGRSARPTRRRREALFTGRLLAPQFFQACGFQLDQLGQLRQQLLFEGAFGQQLPQWSGLAGQAGAALGGLQVAVGAGRFDQKARQRHGLLDLLGKSFLSEFAHIAVGVVFGGQKQELDAAHIGGVGQGAVECLAGGAAACAVAVKAEDHRVGEAKQLLHMLGRAGRAQRGHGVGKAELGQRHHVHVAFGHQHIARAVQGFARFVQAVQLAAFVKDRGFGRVQVFGGTAADHPPTKADAFAFDVADREHDAVPKTVVAFVVFFVDDHQARFGQERVVVFGEDAGQ